MKKKISQPTYKTDLILEELEARQLFSGGIEGLIDTSLLSSNTATYMDVEEPKDQASPDEATNSTSATETRSHEVVFVDTSVENYQSLVDDLLNNADNTRMFEVVLLEPDQNGIEAISQTLQGYDDLDAVHIISHGSDGEVQLGNTSLNDETLAQNNLGIALWANAFDETGDILIYGCNLTETEDGQSLVNRLSELTLTDIAASDDLTGDADKGGDWELEYSAGTIESDVAISTSAQSVFKGVLDISTGLVGHYTFDTDASDSTANNNDGTLQGNAAIDTNDSSDIVGEGKLSLDGSSDFIDLSAHTASYSALTEGTISAWINTTDFGENTIFGLNDVGADEEITKFSVEGGQLKWLAINDNGGYVIAFSDINTLNDGNWHHVAVTVGPSGNQMYIDGAAASATYSSGSSSDTDFFNDMDEVDTIDIGRSLYSGSSSDFNGLIDEVRVYDNALIASDITQLATVSTAPIASDDSASTNQNTPVIINVIANDTDQDGDTLTVVETTEPSNGSVVINGDGTVTYTPDTDYIGPDSFDYTIIDSSAGLQHYYGFNGDATDAAGSSNGTLTGTTTVAGSTGNGLSFNETSDQINIPDVTYASEFTVSFDFKVDDLNGSLFQYLYSHGDVNSTNSLNIFMNEDSHSTGPNMLRTVIRDSNDTLDNTALQVNIASLVGDSQWHTYTLTVGENGAEVFIDGVSVAIDATRGTDALDPAGDLYIGVRQDLNADRRYGGSLDSLAIYSTALDSDKVADISTNSNKATVNITVDTVAEVTYPTSNGIDNSYEWITNVSFAGIDQTSGADAGGYNHYTGTTGSITPGDTYQLSVTINSDIENYVNAWIDWNQDGDFADPNESYVLATNTGSNGPHTIMITAPNDAVEGDIRMRVSVKYQGAATSTEVFTYGEVEDYTLNVAAAVNLAPTGLTTTSTQKGGVSLNEDGGNDAYLLADNGGTIFNGLTSFTIESQFSISTQSADETTLLSYASSTFENEVKLVLESNARLSITIGGVEQLSTGTYLSLTDGETHHLAASWDSASGSVTLYVDGVLAESFSSIRTGYTVAGSGTLLFGQEQDSLGGGFETIDQFQGTLYDVRIFNDVRSAGEIAASYNTTLPNTESGMIANWTFNGLSTSGVVTETVSGNNLTVQHAGGGSFVSSTPTLSLEIDENASNGTAVGTVYGVDSEREAMIATLLAANPNLSYNAETGKFYESVAISTTWATANSNALTSTLSGVSGQLSVIHSATENEVLFNLSQAMGDSVWLAGSDQASEGEWYWQNAGVDQDQFWSGDASGNSINGAYTNWGAGQPNDLSGEDAIRLSNIDGLWYDATVDTYNHYYVIEWKADDVLDATDALTYSIQTQSVAGAFSINSDSGEITVADGSLLDYETATTHNITVRVTDSGGLTYDEVFSIAVTNVFEQSAITDNVSTNEDTPLIINPRANDIGTVSVIEFTQPTHGIVVDNGNGTFTYTPDSDYNGADSFDYVITDTTANLSHYWNLDGVATDSFGVSHGTLNGTTTVAGDVGNGLSFNETSDYVEMPDVTYTDDFTVSFDIKIDENTGSLFQYIYSHGDINTTNSLNIYLNEATHATDPNVIRTVIRDANDTLDYTALEFDASAIIGDGQWHTYTLTVGADGSKVYLDGTLQNSDSRGGEAIDPTTSLFLGIRSDLDPNRMFGGSLDSVQIYDSALSTSQVSDMAAGSNQATVNITVDPVNDAPVVDLNGIDDAGTEISVTFTEDGGAVNVTDSDAIISDVDHTTFQNLDINLNSISDGSSELITVAGYTFTYGIAETVVQTVGSTDFEIDFDGSGFTIMQNISGDMSLADLQQLMQGVTYENSSDNPTEGNRTIDFIVQDASGLASSIATSTVSVSAVNDAPTFGVGDGMLTTTIASGDDKAFSVTTQADGKILLAGNYFNGTDNDFFLTRYNSDGTLDISFGNNGIVTTAIGAANEVGDQVIVQADGKILLVGRSHNGSDWDFAIARYNVDGSLDTSFSTDGYLTTAIGAGNDTGRTVALQADGKILVGGGSSNGSNNDFALVRYNADGSLDTSFDIDGIVTTPIGTSGEEGFTVEVQSDGKIVLAGYSIQSGTARDFALVRYNSDGSLDSSFSIDGMTTVAPGSGWDEIYNISIQSDDKILVTGTSSNGTDYDFTVVRFNSDGTPDTSFSGDGVLTTAIGSGEDVARDITVLSDGKILVSGYTHNDTDNDFAVVKYLADGTLDSSFGTGGILTTDSSGDDKSYGLSVQDDGKIVLGGYSHNGSDFDVALVRYNADGTLDQSFDTGILGATVNYIENGPAVVMDSDVTIFDAELSLADNFDGSTLTIIRNGGASAEDVISASGTLSTLTEGGSLVVGGTTIGTVTTNSSGTLVLTFNSSATNALVNSAMQQIAYSNTSEAPPASVQLDWTFDDGNSGSQGSGGALTTIGSTTVNITAVNDNPTVSDINGDVLNYDEGDGAVLIDQLVNALVGDVDSTNFAGGDLNIECDSGLQAGEDVFAINHQGTSAGQIGVSGSDVTYGGVNIGTFSGGTGITPLNIAFNANANSAAVTVLLQNITYENTDASNPTAGVRNLSIDISDGDGGSSSTQNMTINVSTVNDAAVIAGIDTGAVQEDVAVVADNIATSGTLTIADPDSGESTFQADTFNGTYGDLTIDTAGHWSYTADNTQAAIQQLDLGESMIDTLTVTSFDGTTHNVVITINGSDDAAVIGGTITGSVTEDGTLTSSGALTISDTDTSDPTNFVDVSTTASDNGYGSFAMTGNTWTFTLDNNNAAVQALDVGETLTDTFTFTAPDGVTQQVTVTINGAEDTPMFDSTAITSATEDSAYSYTITTSDVDIETVSITASTLPTWLTLVDNGDGTASLTGTPTNAEVGNHSVVLNVNDGDVSSNQSFTISVANTNDAAVIGGTGTGSVQEDIAVVTNNISTTGTLTIVDPDSGESTFQAGTVNGTYGDLTIDTAGNWSYATDNTQTAIQQLDLGESIGDTLTVTSFDGTTHNVVITINGSDDTAVIGGTITGSVTEDGTLTSTGALTITDTDSSDPTNFVDIATTASDNGYGTFAMTGNSWTYSLNNGHSTVQALDIGETLTDTFTFTATDGVTQQVSVTINGAEDTPVFDSTAVTAATEDSAYSYSITTSDVDIETVTITATTLPTWLTLTDNGDGTATLSGTPTNAEVGDHSVVLNVNDGEVNSNQSFTITVANTNDAAVIAGTDTGSVQEDIAVVTNNISTTGTLTIVDPDSGESTFQAGTINGTYGDLVIDTAGNWSYSADNTQAAIQQLDLAESMTDTLTVTAFDGTTHNVVITIDGSDDAAVIGGTITGSVTEDGTLTSSGALTISDTDTSDPTNFVDVSTTSSDNGYGTFAMTGNSWTFALDNNNAAVQALDVGETLTDTFTFTAPDGVTQQVSVTINGAEDTPVFDSTAVTSATEDSAYSYTITTSDVDIETVSITASTLPTWLTLVDNGDGTASLTGTPTNAEVGNHSVVLNVNDGDVNSNQSFTISVANTNDAAVIGGTDTGSVQEDVSVMADNISTSGALTIVDPDTGESTFQATTIVGSFGDLTIDASGNWSYAADNTQPSIQVMIEGETISDSFNIRSADGTIHNIVITINGAKENAVFTETTIITDIPVLESPDEDENVTEIIIPDSSTTGGSSQDTESEIIKSTTDLDEFDGSNQTPIHNRSTIETTNVPFESPQGTTPKNEQSTIRKPQSLTNLIQQQAFKDQLANQALLGNGDLEVNPEDEEKLLDKIDAMQQQIDESSTNDADDVEIKVALSSSIGLTTGFIAWILRGGSLLASMITTLPILNRFDPLPIVKSRKDKPCKDDSESEQVSKVEKLFSRNDDDKT